jgi:hypothetical protein
VALLLLLFGVYADIAKVQHKVMGWNDNKTGEQSNGLKVEVAIFIFLLL